MAVAYLSSSRGWNTTQTLACPAGTNRFIMFSHASRGYFAGWDGTPWAQFNGVYMSLLGDIVYGAPSENVNYGYAKAMGMAVPDSWGTGTYSFTNYGIGYNMITWFTGVDPNNPFSSNRAAYHADVNAATASLTTPAGGAHVITVGSQNDQGQSFSVSGFSAWYAAEDTIVAYKCSAGGETVNPSVSPETPRGCVVQYILNPVPEAKPTSSVIWW